MERLSGLPNGGGPAAVPFAPAPGSHCQSPFRLSQSCALTSCGRGCSWSGGAFAGYHPTRYVMCGFSWKGATRGFGKYGCLAAGAHPPIPFVYGGLQVLSASLIAFVARSPHVAAFVEARKLLLGQAATALQMPVLAQSGQPFAECVGVVHLNGAKYVDSKLRNAGDPGGCKLVPHRAAMLDIALAELPWLVQTRPQGVRCAGADPLLPSAWNQISVRKLHPSENILGAGCDCRRHVEGALHGALQYILVGALHVAGRSLILELLVLEHQLCHIVATPAHHELQQ